MRFWKYGQIALTAKARIDLLLMNENQQEAKSMIEEWTIR
jgi:hypothetical protein